MPKLYDVSLEIHPGMIVWPGDDDVELARTQKMEEGAHNNLSRLCCGVHTGTHVDAPFHFLREGKTVDQLALDILMGPAWIAELPNTSRLRGADLEAAGIPDRIERLLLKTDNSRLWSVETSFREDYVGLEESGARWILGRGIRLVGVDYLSVASRDQTGPVHQVLLKEEVILVEGLNLSAVPAGRCRFYCLPLKLRGSDGALARAVVEVD